MFIKKLEFKNINSYGNNLQTLEFDNKGGLILLVGHNGTGKSTIKQSLELCLFGKVQGKSGKRLALTKLPNRRNGNLYTGVFFKNQLGQDIIMKRYIQPNNFEMFVNEEPYTERFKIMSEKDREKLIGYSFEIFKSFISLNMNDFKNFISLSKEDKENLLNKLFNLNDLDTLYSITKDLDISNQKLITDLNNEIYHNEQSILEYRQTIQNIKLTQQKTRNERLTELKEQIISKKPTYIEYEEEIKSLDKQKEDTNKKLSKLYQIKSDKQKEKTKLEVEIESLEEKIKVFESGICPVCDTDLSEGHDAHLTEMHDQIKLKKQQIQECDKFLERCILEDTKIRNTFDSIYNKKNDVQNKLTELKTELALLNKEYKNLKNQSEDNTTENLETKINILKETNKQKSELLKSLNKKSEIYEELKKMFSVDGVRKSMIKNALIPINKYLNNYLTKLNSEYHAQLNENFDANIFELGILNIDPETLSKGEDKKINIAIALSYLNLVLELKQSNIMFLDEIFDGVDVNNINLTLNVLREIALEHKINIIIVNHGMEQIVDLSIFDKIIRTSKDIFSNVEIIDNDNIT
ncbi:MAG: AAA family ATPase [Ignavibacteria bacterium]|nr:AAA family ATPase [Ignavibacteria bacterium]